MQYNISLIAIIFFPHFLLLSPYNAVVPLITGDMAPDPHWLPETADSTEPYIHSAFLYVHASDKFDLQIKHRRRLTTVTTNITEQLYKMLLKNSVIEVFFSAYLIGRCS